MQAITEFIQINLRLVLFWYDTADVYSTASVAARLRRVRKVRKVSQPLSQDSGADFPGIRVIIVVAAQALTLRNPVQYVYPIFIFYGVRAFKSQLKQLQLKNKVTRIFLMSKPQQDENKGSLGKFLN